jgi:hypothetical protein
MGRRITRRASDVHLKAADDNDDTLHDAYRREGDVTRRR